MSGSTRLHSSSNDTKPARAVREDVDLERTVWFGGGEAYHRDASWGPACPEHVGRTEEKTLGDAAENDLRPCKKCQPVDYRPLVTDGGEVVEPEGLWSVVTARALVEDARDAAADLDDVHRARLELVLAGLDDVDGPGGLLDEIGYHLETLTRRVDDVDVTHPVRNALQFVDAVRAGDLR